MSTINFYRDQQLGTDFVAIRFTNVLIVLHEDTVATYKVIPYDPANHHVIDPRWTGPHLRDKLLQWSAVVQPHLEAGVEANYAKMQGRPTPVQQLLDAADAVVKRWDSPDWKDTRHTADYIHKLRDAAAKVKGEPR